MSFSEMILSIWCICCHCRSVESILCKNIRVFCSRRTAKNVQIRTKSKQAEVPSVTFTSTRSLLCISRSCFMNSFGAFFLNRAKQMAQVTNSLAWLSTQWAINLILVKNETSQNGHVFSGVILLLTRIGCVGGLRMRSTLFLTFSLKYWSKTVFTYTPTFFWMHSKCCNSLSNGAPQSSHIFITFDVQIWMN